MHSDLAGIDASPAAAACVGFRVADNVFLLPSPEGAHTHMGFGIRCILFVKLVAFFECIFQYSFLIEIFRV
jgi:hypothetical protein